MNRSLFFLSRLYGERFGRKAQKFSLLNPAELPFPLRLALHSYSAVLVLFWVAALAMVLPGWRSAAASAGGMLAALAAKTLLEARLDARLEPFFRRRGP